MTKLPPISVLLVSAIFLVACNLRKDTDFPKENRGKYTVEYVRIPVNRQANVHLSAETADDINHPSGKHQTSGCYSDSRQAPLSFVSAYLLLPADRPAGGSPGIVLFHDHGARYTIGKEKMVRPLSLFSSDSSNALLQEEAQQWVDKFYDGMFIGDSLAAHGYAVLVPDALGWGERMFQADSFPAFNNRLFGDSLKHLNKQIRNSQPLLYLHHLDKTGETWFETILADDNTAFQWLADRPEVNAERIGVVGFSMGAYRAWNLAAENHHISWCAAANWMTTLEANGGPTPNESSWSMYRPMLDSVDYPEIAARITCPFLLIYGSEDPLFSEESVLQAAKQISNPSFTLKRVESAHRFTTEHLNAVFRFSDKQSVR